MPHVAPNHIEKGTGRLLDRGTVKEDAVTSSKHLFEPGQILYSKIRPNLAKAVVVDFAGLCSADMYPIVPHISTAYLHWFMLSDLFTRQVVSDDNRVAMPKVNQAQLRSVHVPVPPLAEQRRIVARVDELMALLDDLEQAQDRRERTRVAARDSTLDALRSADSPEEVEVAWGRFAESVGELICDAEDVEPLRQCVLQLGVSGRLVRQQPADGTGRALFAAIVNERARAARGRRGRSGQAATSTCEPESGGPIPSSWALAPFGEVLLEIVTGPFGTSLKKSDYREGGTPVVNPQNLRSSGIVPTASTCVGDETLQRLASFRLRPGDVVVARRGEMGRCAVATDEHRGWLCGTGCLVLRVPDAVTPAYLALFLRSPLTVDRLSHESVGATMRNLNQRIMLNLPFGLPPTAEQHRIVARVDELMDLLDRLEARLVSERSAQTAFAAAAVHHLDA